MSLPLTPAQRQERFTVDFARALRVYDKGTVNECHEALQALMDHQKDNDTVGWKPCSRHNAGFNDFVRNMNLVLCNRMARVQGEKIPFPDVWKPRVI